MSPTLETTPSYTSSPAGNFSRGEHRKEGRRAQNGIMLQRLNAPVETVPLIGTVFGAHC